MKKRRSQGRGRTKRSNGRTTTSAPSPSPHKRLPTRRKEAWSSHTWQRLLHRPRLRATMDRTQITSHRRRRSHRTQACWQTTLTPKATRFWIRANGRSTSISRRTKSGNCIDRDTSQRIDCSNSSWMARGFLGLRPRKRRCETRSRTQFKAVRAAHCTAQSRSHQHPSSEQSVTSTNA